MSGRARSVAFAVAALLPEAAHADGAFPDAMRILVPADHPQTIYLGTNFGLVLSTDGGAHFQLVCEEAVVTGGENVTQYLIGPQPADTLYALSLNQVAVSENGGCSWSAAGGTWKTPNFTDLFPDPTKVGRVFAVASVLAPQGGFISTLWTSSDAAHTFTGPLFSAASSVLITGVESAASDPSTVYLTEFGNTTDGVITKQARSTDGAMTFAESSLGSVLGTGEPRLAAVDPTDPKVIYYRVLGDSGDTLAISRDGGQTARMALSVGGFMTTFLRRADGTLLVGTQLQGAFTSHDGGATFVPWPEAPHLRALAERAGVLYAAADNSADGYALGSSTDGGKTWTPLLRFANLCGVASCGAAVTSTCNAAWSRLVTQLGITGCAEPTTKPAGASGCAYAGSEGSVSGLLIAAGLLVARARHRFKRARGRAEGARWWSWACRPRREPVAVRQTGS